MYKIWKQNSFALPSNRQLIEPWRHQLPVHVYGSQCCHNALENFHFLSVSLLHSLVLNVVNLRILYDVIIVGDVHDCVFHTYSFLLSFMTLFTIWFLEVSINKNWMIRSVANNPGQSYQYHCTKADGSVSFTTWAYK